MIFTAYASGSAGNLYTISDGTTSLIIECGLPYREIQRLLPMAPSEYAACVVSHQHGDHYNSKSADELQKRGITIHRGLVGVDHVKTRIGTVEVKPFEVKHDVPNYGFLFRSRRDGETCVFLIDTFYSPVKFSFSPTIIAIECNYARDLMKPGDSINDRLFASHMSLDQCIKTLKPWDLSQTREIWLLHLSDERSDEARFQKEVQCAFGIPTYIAPAWKRKS